MSDAYDRESLDAAIRYAASDQSARENTPSALAFQPAGQFADMLKSAGLLHRSIEPVPIDEIDPTPEQLRELPSRQAIEHEVARWRHEVARLDGRPFSLAHDRAASRLRVAQARLRWCDVRDHIIAARPAGCECYGDGVTTAGRYCPCAAGDRRSFEVQAARAEAEAERGAMLAGRIFEYADDLVEFADVTLDSYLARSRGYSLDVRAKSGRLAARLREWCDNSAGAWLVLSGPTGSGKTGLSVACLRLLAQRGQRGLIVTEPSLLRRLRAARYRRFDEDTASEVDVVEALSRAPLLCIDDMGAPGSLKQDEQAQLFDILNARYSGRRRTILTTNLDASEGEEFDTYLGPRISSRVWERAEHGKWVVSVDHVDLRQRPGVLS